MAEAAGSGSDDGAREQAVRRLKAQRGFKGLLISAAGVIALMVVVWLVSGGGYFWPIWVVFGLGIGLIASGWQAYGPRDRGITEDEIEREMGERR